MAERAEKLSIDRGANALSAILNDKKPVLFGQCNNGRHVAGRPFKCTGIIARVADVMWGAMVAAVTSSVSRSMSANTGVAPTMQTHDAVATKLRDGTMTSSPGPTLSARNAISIAADPLATATAPGA